MKKTVKVENSFLKEIQYDGKTLTLTFSNGVYEYPDFPEQIVNQLLETEHKGTFFRRYIRGQYEGIKV